MAGAATAPAGGPRVVVERLDSLGPLRPAAADGVARSTAGDIIVVDTDITTKQPLLQDTLSLVLTASSIEEEAYTPVTLSLDTNISFYPDTLETPTNTSTEQLLDTFLADSDLLEQAEAEHWTRSLDDLFPDLD